MSEKTNSDIAVSVQNLEKKFGQFTAVNRINFEVKQGESTITISENLAERNLIKSDVIFATYVRTY